MSSMNPRSLFAVEDDGLIQRLDFSDSETEATRDDLDSSAEAGDDFTSPLKCGYSPIRRHTSSSEDERLNSSTDSVMSSTIAHPIIKKKVPSRVDTTPPYRKVRALRLFGLPQSPKTLLMRSELECNTEKTENTETKVLTPRHDINHNVPRIRLSQPWCKFYQSPNLEANVNPFNLTPIVPGSNGKRRRDSGICRTPFNDSIDQLSDNELENVIHPTKRMHLRDHYSSRYESEFVEVGQIGSGQFGSVYRCIHRLDGCAYAIKKSRKPLKGTSDERTALNEVYAHAVLGHHKHVVRYFSAWAENDHMLIQNEYCNGGSLAQAIEERRAQLSRFSESEVKHILLHIARGLRYIHSLNLAHMDIKPGNIFITRRVKPVPVSPNSSDDGFEEDEDLNDDEFTYKIGDMGHVTSLTNPEVEEGDCRYLPSEILQDNYDHLPKSDIFALGLTIYEVCGGGPLPKNGDEWHTIRNGNLPYASYYSKELNILIKEMIHPDPNKRPTSASLVQNRTIVPYVCKTKEQLNKELNAEKFKNQLLARQLQRASQSLKTKSSRAGRLLGGKVNRSSSVTNF